MNGKHVAIIIWVVVAIALFFVIKQLITINGVIKATKTVEAGSAIK